MLTIKNFSTKPARIKLILLIVIAVAASLIAVAIRSDESYSVNAPERSLEQDLNWGVLAINTPKNVYKKGETASFTIGILDEMGLMVCDSNILMVVTTPGGEKINLSTDEGTISMNEECYIHDVTHNADFDTQLLLEEEGWYTIDLMGSNSTGDYHIQDALLVDDNYPVVINRHSSTRIYPQSEYPVEFDLEAQKTGPATIVERVPKSFEISQLSDFPMPDVTEDEDFKILKWDVEFVEGEKLGLGYIYKAPITSPEFYSFEPLIVQYQKNKSWARNLLRFPGPAFSETRQWMIASDAVTHEETETGTATSNPSSVSTSAALTSVTDHLYLAAVSSTRGNTISSVSGLGLTWTLVDDQCASRAGATLSVYKALGTPTGDSVVTANFSTTDSYSASIAVTRYSGIDTTTPIGNTDTANTNGDAGSCAAGDITLGDTSYSAQTNPGSTATVTHTVGAGSNRLLIALIPYENGDFEVFESVVWDAAGANEAMTEIGSGYETGDDAAVHSYYLVNPTVGTDKVITATVTSPETFNSEGVSINAYSLTGVDQTNPIRQEAGYADAGASSYDSVLSNAVDQDFIVAAGDIENSYTSDWSGSTITMNELHDSFADASYFSSAYGVSDGVDTINQTFSGTDHGASMAVAIAPDASLDDSSPSVSFSTGANNSVVYSAISPGNRTVTPGSGYTERGEASSGSSGNDLGIHVQDKTQATAGAVAPDATLSGNANWIQVGVEVKLLEVTKTLSGTVYTDEGSTNIGANKTVNVRINGSGSYTDETDSNGDWSISGLTLNSGDMIAVYLDGETEKASMVFKSDGGTKSDIDLYQNHAIFRSDTGSVSMSDLATGDNGDTDILYNSSGSVLDIEGSAKAFIWASSNIALTTGYITSNTLSEVLKIDDNATLTLGANGSTFNGDINIQGGGTLNLNANATLSGDLITAGTSAVVDYSSGTPTLTIDATSAVGGGTTPSLTFYNLTTSGSYTTTLSNAITVENDLSVGTGSTLTGAVSVDVQGGDATGAGTVAFTGGTFTLEGTGNFNGGTSSWSFYNLTFGDGVSSTTTTATSTGSNTISNVLTIADSHTLEAGSNSWTVSGAGSPFVPTGTFTADTSSFSFTSASAVSVPELEYYDLFFSPVSGTPTYTIEATQSYTAPVVNYSTATVSPASGGSVTTHPFTLPGHSEGDQMYLWVELDGTAGSISPPSGWDTVTGLNSIYDASSELTISLWTRTAGASEPSTDNWTSTDAERGQWIAWSVSNDGGMYGLSSEGSGTGTTATVPSIFTTADNEAVIRLVANDGVVTSFGTATGHTVIGGTGYASAGSVAAQFINQASTGSTGTASISMNVSDTWSAWTFAIAGIGGGGGGGGSVTIGDTSVNAVTNPGTSSTLTHTVGAGDDSMLLVFVNYENDNFEQLTGVVWDAAGANEALTELGTGYTTVDDASVHAYYLLNPTAGTDKLITASFDSAVSAGAVAMQAYSLTGVSQSSPFSQENGDASPNVASLSAVLSGANSGDLIIASSGVESTGTTDWTSSSITMTEIQDTQQDASTFSTAHGVSEGSDTITAAFSVTSHAALMAVAVNPASVQASGTLTVHDLTLAGSGAVTVDATTNDPTVVVNGDFSISSGDTWQSSDASELKIAGDFTNNGTFTHNSGTTRFLTTDTQSLLTYSANTTFYDVIINSGTKRMLFPTNYRTIVAGDLTVNGGSCSTPTELYSDSTGTQYELEVTGTESVQYSYVRDSNAINALSATNTINRGNTTSWTITEGVCSAPAPTNNGLLRGGAFWLRQERQPFTF